MGHSAENFVHKTKKEQQKVYLNTGPSPPYARKCSFWVVNSKVAMNCVSTSISRFCRELLERSAGTQHKIWSFRCVGNMQYQRDLGKAVIILERDQLMPTSELETLLKMC